jgi:ribonuclease R
MPKGKSLRDEKLFQNLLRVTYEYIKGKRYSPQSKESLIERLKINAEHLDIFERVLIDLKESGKIHEAASKFVAPSDEKAAPNVITGKISVHPRGFGFVELDDDPNGQDVFIPKPYMFNAIDGDIVEVLVNPEITSEKGPEGKVVTIVKRTRKQLVGTVYSLRGGEIMAFCTLLGQAHKVIVSHSPQKDEPHLTIGDRVLLDVSEWGSKTQNTYATLAKLIGNISDPKSDIPTAVLEHEIRTKFSKEATAAAIAFGNKVTKKDMEGREDLRDIECFTIDPDTAKDFDDALSLTFEKGIYTLGVHIADVSHYVQAESILDSEASMRCNSTYFPGTCIPMLPPELSDNLCSLREGVIRLTVSVFVEIDMKGNTKSWRISRSFIKSNKRFTYKQAKKVLDGTMKSKHAPTLKMMLELCHLLKAKRAERGSVQLYMPEFVIKVDPDGVPVGTEVIEYDITHQLVEEFMLKANEIVAFHLTKQGKNVTFRVHEEPAKESLREFAALATAFGYQLSPDPTPQEIQTFFSTLEENKASQYLSTCYIRSMRLACYSPDNIGHYGLSLEHYCHFTSPIRRYVDTIVHRLLFEKNVERDELARICNKASEKERISAKAEGNVIAMKKLRLLQTTAAQTPYKQFEAVVTRVKPFGIYFDVLDFMLEGFLHISDLDDDYFDYSDDAMMLVGRHAGFSYKAGDRLLVMMRSIDLIQMECSWSLVTHSDFEPLSDEKRAAVLPRGKPPTGKDRKKREKQKHETRKFIKKKSKR